MDAQQQNDKEEYKKLLGENFSKNVLLKVLDDLKRSAEEQKRELNEKLEDNLSMSESEKDSLRNQVRETERNLRRKIAQMQEEAIALEIRRKEELNRLKIAQ